MKCPYCGYLESKVIDSRPAEEGASIRRRRECLTCQRRFTTYEIMERQGIAPHVSKSVFYEARMRFFWLLDKEKE